MKKILLSLLFLGILVFPSYVHADGPYLNIPPTNAFDKIHSQNGTVSAVNFSMPLTIKGTNGISVQSSNKTHTVIIIGNGTGARGATGATGNFTCNTSHNCVNISDTQKIQGEKTFKPPINFGYLTLTQPGIGITNLQNNDSQTFGEVTHLQLLVGNNTDPTTAIDLYGDLQQNHDLAIGAFGASAFPEAFFGWFTNDTSPIIIYNRSGPTNETILGSENGINFNNATLHNIQLPSLNLDAVNKYYFDHNIGKIGNLTQNKCSNLEFLAYQQSNQTWICSTGSFHGTYNETLANNAVINSGGSKINFINETGKNTVNVVNSNSGQQVNVTINSPSQTLTQSLVDMTSLPSVSTTDNDTADTLITATTEPASPQFVQTVGVLPANADVSQWGFILTVGGKNTDTHNKQLTVRITINGANVGSSSTTTTITTANPFWRTQPSYCGQAINQNDKVGLKMWANVTNTVDFRYATIYLVPCDFKATGTVKALAFPTTTSTTSLFSGAVSGVTYVASSLMASQTTTDSILGSQTATQYSWFFSPQTISMFPVANTNTNTTPGIIITAAASLSSFSSLHYYEKIS